MTWLIRSPLFGSTLARTEEDSLSALHRQINRAFDDLWHGGPGLAATTSLRLDVKEDEKQVSVAADLPGLTEKDVEVTFDDGVLTIRGEKKIERDEKSETWHIVERSQGSFARQLSVATPIDSDKIEARFDKGVLTITLPKLPVEQAKAKKIAIKTES